jgi:transposase
VATITKRKRNGHAYYYLVESARVNGKPRIVYQKYLGTAETIGKAADLAKNGGVPDPEFSTVLDFGAVAALLGVADRLGVRDIINKHAGKRDQGLSVGDSILIAAINRAVEPASKKGMFEWFDETVLDAAFPDANEKNLSSQGFWNNMNRLDADKIRAIEDDITKAAVEKYGIRTDCLLYDNTNFFTYIDTSNPMTMARRGKSKEHRSDLRIVGLSLMVAPEYDIPLFHEPYAGNVNDARRFSETLDPLKARYAALDVGECDATLVFDRGNNSETNVDDLRDAKGAGFHFVGGLKLNQMPEMTSIPIESFRALTGTLSETKSYRTTKRVFGDDYDVVVTFNPELFDAQLDGVEANVAKCQAELEGFRESLKRRADGLVTKGRKPTVASAEKKVSGILSAEHMRKLFDVEIAESDGCVELSFTLNETKRDELKRTVLGRSILFTDRREWTDEEIVGAYRSQYRVEECFKQLKDTKHLSFRPIRHFTDSSIRVHALYCVLSLLLCGLLNKEFAEMGHATSVHRMLDELGKAQRILTVFPKVGKNKPVKSSFSKLSGPVGEYVEKYGLKKYCVNV